MKVYKFFMWLTNNDRNEDKTDVRFDLFFFTVNTLCILSVYLFAFFGKIEPGWVPAITIEYFWAFEQIRNNR